MENYTTENYTENLIEILTEIYTENYTERLNGELTENYTENYQARLLFVRSEHSDRATQLHEGRAGRGRRKQR